MSSKRSLRHRSTPPLDFSPMAALGLMLVNFFMLQMMWQKPQVMPVIMPDNKPHGCCECESVKESKVFTLLCAKEKVCAYAGLTEPKLDSTDYSAAGLRQIILLKNAKWPPKWG